MKHLTKIVGAMLLISAGLAFPPLFAVYVAFIGVYFWNYNE